MISRCVCTNSGPSSFLSIVKPSRWASFWKAS